MILSLTIWCGLVWNNTRYEQMCSEKCWSLRWWAPIKSVWSTVPSCNLSISIDAVVTFRRYLVHKLGSRCENMAPVCIRGLGRLPYLVWSLGICPGHHSHHNHSQKGYCQIYGSLVISTANRPSPSKDSGFLWVIMFCMSKPLVYLISDVASRSRLQHDLTLFMHRHHQRPLHFSTLDRDISPLLCLSISTCCSLVHEPLWPAAVLGMLVNNALVPLQAGTLYRSPNNCKEKH